MILIGIIILILAFFFYASYSINSNIYVRAFCKKSTTEKIVAITFDDGPDSIQTPRVLKMLEDNNTPACFFCIGNKIDGNEMLLRQMLNQGHLIGNHSYTHSNFFPFYGAGKMRNDLLACQEKLEKVTLQKIRFFRPPFGVTNPTIAKVVKELGYVVLGWNIRTRDTQQLSHEKIVKHVRRRLSPGSIILLHDRVAQSDVLLEKILDLLKEEGYTVVRADQMIHENK